MVNRGVISEVDCRWLENGDKLSQFYHKMLDSTVSSTTRPATTSIVDIEEDRKDGVTTADDDDGVTTIPGMYVPIKFI